MADRAKGVPVALEGVPFILVSGGMTVGSWLAGWVWPTCLLGALSFFIAWFFRNPARTIPPGDDVVVSPGDGAVVGIESDFEHRFLKEPAVRISIFLNVFNVHINRMPIGGIVQQIVYQPGQFIAANKPGASNGNEQNALLLERADGTKVLCVQIAGLIARRIICWAHVGETVEKGERFGLIRFGSRMDVYLPQASVIRVKVGDKVKGGSSIIAGLPPAEGI